MKILIAGRGSDSMHCHEIGIFEHDQACALRAAGHDVRFAALDVRSIRRLRPWGCRTYTYEDGMTVYYNAFPLGAVPERLHSLVMKRVGKQLFRYIRHSDWKPDVIHAHFSAGIALYSEANRTGIPFVYTEHYSGANRENVSAAELACEKELYPHLDAFLCVSSVLAANIEKNTGAKPTVLPNIVDTGAFAPALEAHEGFHFVSAGRLRPEKGFSSLLEAFSRLRDMNSTLTIFGEGAERGAIEARIRDLQLENRVFLRGYCPRKEMAQEYARSDCFVLPSCAETFGVAYIEAMAAGLPVIATRCGGPEDFVNEDNGLLVPTDDISALAAAMQDMMENRARYDSAAIAAETRRCFSPEQIAGELTELYEGIVQSSTSPR